MDEGAGPASGQGPEYGELVGLSCSSNGVGLHATIGGQARTHHGGPNPHQGLYIGFMKSNTKSWAPPTQKTTLAWEQLECFGSKHPQELMIFREGIRLIPYSLLLLPPMDIWHIGRRPSIFQESFDLGPRHSTPPCVQINIHIHMSSHIACTWPGNTTLCQIYLHSSPVKIDIICIKKVLCWRAPRKPFSESMWNCCVYGLLVYWWWLVFTASLLL